MERVGGAVLAGGRSRRMGRSKALIHHQGQPLVVALSRTLAGVCRPVVVCHAPGQTLPALPAGVAAVADSVPGQGPLRAIADGLRAIGGEADAVFVAATDLPLLTEQAVCWLAGRLRACDSAVVPVRDGRPQPLAAVYRVSLLATTEALLASGERRAMALAEVAGVRLVDAAGLPDPAALTNVNTPTELAAARRLIGG